MVSDAPAVQAWLRLEYLKLGDLFDTVITFDDTGKWKPAPQPFRLALERLNIHPSEAVMLGDWVDRDLAGAKKIGMKTVHARYGSEIEEIDNQGFADAAIDDISEILDLVDNWK